jgi:hypothetical protein
VQVSRIALCIRETTQIFAQFSCAFTSASHPETQRPSSLRELRPPTTPNLSQFSPLLFFPSHFLPLLVCPMTLALHAVGVLRRSCTSFFLYHFLDFFISLACPFTTTCCLKLRFAKDIKSKKKNCATNPLSSSSKKAPLHHSTKVWPLRRVCLLFFIIMTV